MKVVSHVIPFPVDKLQNTLSVILLQVVLVVVSPPLKLLAVKLEIVFLLKDKFDNFCFFYK